MREAESLPISKKLKPCAAVCRQAKEIYTMTVKELYNTIENRRARSAWDKGVKVYALELLDKAITNGDYESEILSESELKKACLNGAGTWHRYSEGGCSLVYSYDIAVRLCTPSELKRTDNGNKDPNGHEDWIQCQTRALYQAWALICNVLRLGGVPFSLELATAAEVAR